MVANPRADLQLAQLRGLATRAQDVILPHNQTDPLLLLPAPAVLLHGAIVLLQVIRELMAAGTIRLSDEI